MRELRLSLTCILNFKPPPHPTIPPSHLLSRKSFLKSNLKPSLHDTRRCSTFVEIWGLRWLRPHGLVGEAASLEGAGREITEAPGPGLCHAPAAAPAEIGGRPTYPAP